MRWQYGIRNRTTGEIVQKPLRHIKATFKTPNLTYVYGEIYRRQGSDGEWQLNP